MRLRARLAIAAAVAVLPAVGSLFWVDRMLRHRAAEQRLIASTYARISTFRDECEADPASWGGTLTPMPPGGPDAPDHRAPPPGPPPGGHTHRPPPGEPPPGASTHGPSPGEPPLRPPPGGPPPPPPDGHGGAHAQPAEVFAYDTGFRSRNPAAPVIAEGLQSALEGRQLAVEPLAWRSSRVEVLLRMPWTGGPCAVVLARGTTDPGWGAVLPESKLWLLPITVVIGAVLFAVGPVLQRIRRLTGEVRRLASNAYAGTVTVEGNDEIADLSRAFDAAGREVREQLDRNRRSEQTLRRFLSNTTHDVMIPLTVLQGHLAALREQAKDGSRESEILVSAMDEAHYMASIIHNLAVAARLDAGEAALQLSAVDLGVLVERVVARHAPIARQAGVSIEHAAPPEPVRVRADVTILEQAVSNVTYNAVRYNRRGGHVAVLVEVPRPGRFRLRVIDDGPGIPESERARLLERGERGNEARTRAPEGQGLGLHIAFRAAELHGFRLSLRPSEAGGLEVELEGETAAG